jgi:hypothetical protein
VVSKYEGLDVYEEFMLDYERRMVVAQKEQK